jgi:hypothetical protein
MKIINHKRPKPLVIDNSLSVSSLVYVAEVEPQGSSDAEVSLNSE